MERNKLFISILLLLLLPLYTWADQTPTFTASAPEAINVGNQFRLTFTVKLPGDSSEENSIKSFTCPNLQGFEILMGPSRTTSQKTAVTSEKTEKSFSVSYAYILAALNEGNLIIPEATITVKGKVLRSQRLSIHVLPAGKPLPEEKKTKEPDVFVVMNVSERSPLVNSPIILECKIYSSSAIKNITNIKQVISPTDFKIEEVNLKDNQLSMEEYKNESYYTFIFRKLLLYPQRTGQLRIGELSMDAYCEENTSEDPFDAFFPKIKKY